MVAAFRSFASSLHPDVHRVGAGVGEPLQRPGDLHQGPHGAVPGSEFLRGLPTHVRTKALLSSATQSSGVNESSEGAAELICQVLGGTEPHTNAEDFRLQLRVLLLSKAAAGIFGGDPVKPCSCPAVASLEMFSVSLSAKKDDV